MLYSQMKCEIVCLMLLMHEERLRGQYTRVTDCYNWALVSSKARYLYPKFVLSV